jgi:hypothetical protein
MDIKDGRMWTGLMWLGIGTNSGLAKTAINLLFKYNKIWRISLGSFWSVTLVTMKMI